MVYPVAAALHFVHFHLALMTPEQQLHTLLIARRFGGKFVQHLAAAGLAADPLNRLTLMEAFPVLEDSYGPLSALYSEDLG